MQNKNTRIDFNGLIVKNPELVIKIGLVFDIYKDKHECWRIAEAEPKFKAMNLGVMICEENSSGPTKDTTMSCRFYTPKENIVDDITLHKEQ